MGLTVALENEVGESLDRVEDPTNILHRLLPQPEDGRYRLISAIDWYGDTVFNNLQAPVFLEEWRRLEADASGPSETKLLRAIMAMAETLASERHLYLKFYGD